MSITSRQFHFSKHIRKDPVLCEIYDRLGEVVLVPLLEDKCEVKLAMPIPRTFAETQSDSYAWKLTQMDVGVICGVTNGNLCAFATSESIEQLLMWNPIWSHTAILKFARLNIIFLRIEGFCPATVQMCNGSWIGEGEVIHVRLHNEPSVPCEWITTHEPLIMNFRQINWPTLISKYFAPQIVQNTFGAPFQLNGRGKKTFNSHYWAALFMWHQPVRYEHSDDQFYTEDEAGVRKIVLRNMLRAEIVRFIEHGNVFCQASSPRPPRSRELREIMVALPDVAMFVNKLRAPLACSRS